jgi:hypothetical protein
MCCAPTAPGSTELLERLREELDAPLPAPRVCRGTLLSREQYLIDIQSWRYRDARLEADGSMSPGDVKTWTAAIGEPH